MHCEAPIQQGKRKGQVCGRETTEQYCAKHKRQAIIDKSTIEHINYCDIARGCYTVLAEHESKCKHCLHKTRIQERKREDKKRQDSTLCLDCGRTLTEEIRAKGKHDKPLRRCVPCYEKLIEQEKKRPARERNGKAEAFMNQYVMWNHYVKGAKKRGIDFSLSKTLFEALLVQPCFYCNYQQMGEVNGVDRVDNQKGYKEDNVVACCTTCNIIKGSQHPEEFIDKMKAIYAYQTRNEPISSDMIDKWSSTYRSKTTPNYKTYMKSAHSRNILFELSELDFSTLTHQPCYLCGMVDKNGIDRVDNKKGYHLQNCKPCCGHCNLMKKDQSYEHLLRSARQIDSNYDKLKEWVHTMQIKTRASKTEPRIKVNHPETQENVQREYKPLNEVILPQEPIPNEIQQIVEKKEEVPPKQWKTKQIYKSIQENTENEYKMYCEQHNTVEPTWEQDWITFILSVKGKSYKESESNIRKWLENLRRIRHNALCAKDTIEREDREQWPSSTVVKAFLEGKLDKFKTYTETHVGENTEDPKWNKRWSQFVSSLEQNRQNEEKLKERCSTFMTAQRMKKYRGSISSTK